MLTKLNTKLKMVLCNFSTSLKFHFNECNMFCKKIYKGCLLHTFFQTAKRNKWNQIKNISKFMDGS